MSGKISVLVAAAVFLGLGAAVAQDASKSPGAKVFQDLRCNTCHRADGLGLGPPLEGLFGKTVELQGGTTIRADEAYVREAIVNPSAQVAAGFQPIMPTYEGLVTEERLLELIDYVRLLKARPPVPRR